VDDGKSTLIGRLLHDSKQVYEDHLQSIHAASLKNKQPVAEALAFLTDGLRAEREQGITIDVAYRYFSTPKRHFILADTPGHEQYTRNMATGASTAHLSILLIDAEKGLLTQTKRHAFIAALLGVPRFLVAVNKMDLVDYSRERYEEIKQEFSEFAAKLGVKELRFVPVSALRGDNIVDKSQQMSWYGGETVMEYLENVFIGSDSNLVDFRFPVQYVIRIGRSYCGYSGQIASGMIRPGEEVMILPSMRKTLVKSIDVFGNSNASLEEAFAPLSIVLTLQDEIDVSRGDMIVKSNNVPHIRNQSEAMLLWMSDKPLNPQNPLIVQHTSREAKVYIDQIRYRVDVNTLSRMPVDTLSLNEIGRVSLNFTRPLFVDTYQANRGTGNFILIDPDSFLTVAAGMIIDRLPDELMPLGHRESGRAEVVTSTNIHKEEGSVSQQAREEKLGHPAVTLWFTGLSGSGKSSIAKRLEQRLFESGRMIYRLDGDNVRFGLNKDLGYSRTDRSENIRRVAEVAKLMNDAGISVLCSFISPFEADRQNARKIIGEDRFIEVFLSTPLEVCEARDPHGLYRKARRGEISEFTGLSSPYEAPKDPEIIIDTQNLNLDSCCIVIEQYLKNLKQNNEK
ncbi:MAG: adenylyl-sulfate kinase, partial [SAR324 cluster bacterium]|nr:adenylyl-sulfate kinase [SAR324 cluster bacterium]